MKKKITAIAVVLILLSISAMGTQAYFTDSEVAHNIITTGDINIVIEEWAKAPTDTTNGVPFVDVINVMPSQAVDKIVTVKNKEESSDAWVRMWVNVSISDDQKQICLPLEVNGVSIAMLDYDTVNWTRGTDDYWYYNSPLKAGEVTKPLFTKVVIAPETPNEYQETRVLIDVLVEAVQADNNGESALSAEGWSSEEGDKE